MLLLALLPAMAAWTNRRVMLLLHADLDRLEEAGVP
jgi:hypothetical protein